MSEKIKVLIADDHAIFAEGVEELFRTEDTFQCIGKALTVPELKYLLSSTSPDFLLLDVNIKGENSIPFIREIKRSNPHIHILVLTMYEEPLFVKEAKINGANGYLTKDAGKYELLNIMHQIQAAPSQFHYSGKYTKLEGASTDTDPFRKLAQLSAREKEILKLVSEALTYPVIADRLFLSRHTITTHIRTIRKKLGIKTRSGLVKFCLENRIWDSVNL